ncbi:hypothetical protein ES288_A10G237700v1 [Gossypium darwinii]|uniref:ATP-citrate synthase/succinyl-CoA ligase C-terminal domain-containing protein n=1 Tax=Gossypium darwinii TaxID=34276 RepID=A0A5D2F2W1_GOSDA|nr:hypothetical protein ES288_A10G237700v1 [Gossypium darwinii]
MEALGKEWAEYEANAKVGLLLPSPFPSPSPSPWVANQCHCQVVEAFKILTSDDKVKAILVNIFGGIMKCDVIASGIVNAAKQVALKVPVVVRLERTNVDQGKRILKESGMTLITAEDLDDAAKKAVKAASK